MVCYEVMALQVLNVSPEKASGACGGSESGRAGGNHWRSCTICLEEMCQTELKTHHTCEACLLCDGCIEVGAGNCEAGYRVYFSHPFVIDFLFLDHIHINALYITVSLL